ncbi:MAG: tetratricopeptide repeat protein, partial [Nitrospinaceae bacterium]|nr:tetratricopeptide repeat protein [Nitrospinaceae bacterium]NIR53351.1 tetratricopeptide repeat protein [Nitrospinaceae bacterium]NIS83751.1 tetratricopeptide repeat protein [Nitrospinaceae bacterium]NIT80550.1 tetratricopeptide repeat protein [Nitrospinaceae bacterium]NIU42875.1 tetratricopeptide repeat protein [Nitrospinaceae bacterium]
MGIGDWFGNKELQKYKARLTEHPEDAEAHFYLGTIYEKKNQVEAAIREFQEVLRIN